MPYLLKGYSFDLAIDPGKTWKTLPAQAKLHPGRRSGQYTMGGKQLGFSDYGQSTAKKQAKHENVLAVMEAGLRHRDWCKSLGSPTPRHPHPGVAGVGSAP